MGIMTYRLSSIVVLLSLFIFVLSAGSYLLTQETLESPLVTGHASEEVSTRLFVLEVSQRLCNITLVDGFNLVSSYCMPSNRSPDYIFFPVLTNLTSVHAYNASRPDKWMAYNPSLPSWVVQDLDQVSEEQGYWVRVTSNSTLQVNGSYKLPSIMPVYQGWNLVGYPLAVSKNITEGLNDIDGLVSRIWGYNSSDQADPWKLYNPFQDPAFNDLTDFHPLYGYWINMSQDASWYIDE